ncbi:MAG: type II toxin-antitoxin system VapB family antitoxin [Hyphomicrobiales bacterium]|nr:MAG: type II toxin-antitoxin system VapB family antitoxin [Hyphomicrobiales bacterium]
MRTTVTIDDDLLDDAKELTGIKETSRLMREALQVLVAREAGRRLAAMGGSQPDLAYVPRRRPPNFVNEESDYPAPANAEPARKKRSGQ